MRNIAATVKISTRTDLGDAGYVARLVCVFRFTNPAMLTGSNQFRLPRRRTAKFFEFGLLTSVCTLSHFLDPVGLLQPSVLWGTDWTFRSSLAHPTLNV
jgi:hypothetical protein